jgi:hypothetical protein
MQTMILPKEQEFKREVLSGSRRRLETINMILENQTF